MKIFCKDIQEIPSKKRLELLAEKGNLKIEFPKYLFEKDETQIINLLSSKLEDCTVFVGNRTDNTITITIIAVIKKALIKENLDLIIQAIKEYIDLSDLLIRHVSEDKDWENWSINYDHFPHIEYINLKTEQLVDTCAYKMSKYSDIDPEFLGKFIYTTQKYEKLKKLIKEPYHDSVRILDIVQQLGIIQEYLKNR